MSHHRFGGELEERAFTEVRSQGRVLEGYAAHYLVETKIGDLVERIAPGAFTETLRGKGGFRRNGDILALVDHDPGKVLGRTRSGTLTLSEDAKGLKFQLVLPETALGRDIQEMSKRGDLGGMSFSFPFNREGQKWEGQSRTLTNIHLQEVSVVTSFAAYERTVEDLKLRRADFFGDRVLRHNLLVLAEMRHWA